MKSTGALAICILLLACGCRQDTEEGKVDFEEHVARLANLKKEFVEDGGCDWEVRPDDSPSARALFSQEAVPYLVLGLVDTRSIGVIYREEGVPRTTVPLGYLCLNVLLMMSSDDSPVRLPHDQAGWPGWAGFIRERFYFPPDILKRAGGAQRMKRVRHAWQEALDAGILKWDLDIP